ncbi:unnamed protein product, partial [Scytosiphon promiscuus]
LTPQIPHRTPSSRCPRCLASILDYPGSQPVVICGEIGGNSRRSSWMVDVGKHSAAAAAILGGCASACVLLCWAAAAGSVQRRRLAEMEKEVQRQVALRNGEHAGRVKAEKELRAFFRSRMVADGGLFFAPIATVHSCFTECVGTPRQGQFAPSTRALLVFDKGSVSPVSLHGVEEFSHVWVFWAFHLNTNQKDARAHAGVRQDSRGHTFPAKVSPPFLKRRVGIFSTRTPHRPNPIGVSLCKVEEVNSAERSIKLSGVDLVDGTPVLDVKPFVPDYDSPRAEDGSGGGVRVAEWVEASVKHRREVEWAPEAESQLEEACSSDGRRNGDAARMRFFRGNHEGAKTAITESLAVDVRSIRKTREAVNATSCILRFDGLRVEFATTAANSAAGGDPAAGDAPVEAASCPASAASATIATRAAGGARGCCGEGISSSSPMGDRPGEGGVVAREALPPSPFVPSVETVRVLAVRADTRRTSGASDE